MRLLMCSIIAIYALLSAQKVDSTTPTTRGTIEGTVFSAEGVPLPDIAVYATPENSRRGMKVPTRTDASGHFRLENVQSGPTWIITESDEAGYLNPVFAFNSSNRPSMITDVPPGKTTTVQVKLGPKCAYLVGTVRNSEDGTPVHTAIFKLTRADDPRIWRSTAPVDESGNFRLGVPSFVSFDLQVLSEHFALWKPDVQQAQDFRMGLKPSDEYAMKIQLRPLSSKK